MKKQQRVFLLRHRYYRARTEVPHQRPKMLLGRRPTDLSLLDCLRDTGPAQVNSNVMIALRTSPPAPSTIECNMLGESRTFADAVTRFTAEVSSVGATGLNLCAPVGLKKEHKSCRDEQRT